MRFLHHQRLFHSHLLLSFTLHTHTHTHTHTHVLYGLDSDMHRSTMLQGYQVWGGVGGKTHILQLKLPNHHVHRRLFPVRKERHSICFCVVSCAVALPAPPRSRLCVGPILPHTHTHAGSVRRAMRTHALHFGPHRPDAAPRPPCSAVTCV